MMHPNNRVQVNFPNGLSRYRNCQSTETPDIRHEVKPKFSATSDLHCRIGKAITAGNKFRVKSDKIINRNNWQIFFIDLLIIFLVAAWGYLMFRAS